MQIHVKQPIDYDDGVGNVRAHPWERNEHGHQYYDFKRHPELIAQVLEDFRPWAAHDGIQVFYELLRWLNGPDSLLESNDCAFRGPTKNSQPQYRKEMGCKGRLMLFFRQLDLNLSQKSVLWLVNELYAALKSAPASPFCSAEISVVETHFTDLLERTENERRGWEIVITSWAWGESEHETMETLKTFFEALSTTLKLVSGKVPAKRGDKSIGL
ncbi:MAG: hypothetical protein HY644_02540 [Acidobacteria bacterium]|nr:hypothetical protein [Acidobacteriota bacterium]